LLLDPFALGFVKASIERILYVLGLAYTHQDNLWVAEVHHCAYEPVFREYPYVSVLLKVIMLEVGRAGLIIIVIMVFLRVAAGLADFAYFSYFSQLAFN
jgi:hypothetical protein